MTQTFIVGPTPKSKTVQAVSTISGAASSSGLIKIATTAPHNLETGDCIQNAGVTGTVEANGLWTVTVVDGTHFTLNNSVFANAYVSDGTVAHVGYASVGLDVGNSLFYPPPNNLTAIVKLHSAPVNVTCRAILEDASDAGFTTGMAAFTTAFGGGVAPGNDLRRDFRYADVPDVRLASSGDYMRLKILWGKPVVGATFAFTSWLEY